MDEQFNMLLGHTKATTTGKYGILPEGILSDRVKMIEAIVYPNVYTAKLSESDYAIDG